MTGGAARHRVVVVGGSLAGVHAVAGLRSAGFRGEVTVVGAEPYPPYDRPPLSKQLLVGDFPSRPVALPVVADLEARWRPGRRAVTLDRQARQVWLDDGSSLSYDGLVIATGATPVRLPGAGPGAGPPVLRTFDDVRALRGALDAGARRMVVIGAGFLGSEIAAACRQRGGAVTLVDAHERPFQRSYGPVAGEVVTELHRQHGVELVFGAPVTAVTTVRDPAGAVPGGGEVMLGDGRRLVADWMVVALGVRPETGWLVGSGLDLTDGVDCDETCRAAAGVVAAGDVCRWPSRVFGRRLRVEHWTNAVAQGEYAGRRLYAELCGAPAPSPYDPVPYLWTEQYGHQVQVLGRPESGDEVRVVAGDPQLRRFVALHGRGGVVRAVVGMDWPARVRRLQPLVASAAEWQEGIAWANR